MRKQLQKLKYAADMLENVRKISRNKQFLRYKLSRFEVLFLFSELLRRWRIQKFFQNAGKFDWKIVNINLGHSTQFCYGKYVFAILRWKNDISGNSSNCNNIMIITFKECCTSNAEGHHWIFWIFLELVRSKMKIIFTPTHKKQTCSINLILFLVWRILNS